MRAFLSNPVLHPCLGILIYYVSHQGFRHTHMFVQSHSFQLISASIFGSGFSPSLAVETNILPPAGCLGPTGPEKPGAGPRICPPSPQPGCVCWGGVGGWGGGARYVSLCLCRRIWGPFDRPPSVQVSWSLRFPQSHVSSASKSWACTGLSGSNCPLRALPLASFFAVP